MQVFDVPCELRELQEVDRNFPIDEGLDNAVQ